jgi:hypothetical protein
MRTRVSFVLVVLALCATAPTAHAGGPGVVYTDFAQDGKLSCDHSRADLEAALRSGTLNQYGDPLTLAGMKLAVRKQLAGGCKQGGVSSAAPSQTTTGTTGAQGGGGDGGGGNPKQPKANPANPRQPNGQPTLIAHGSSTSQDNGSFLAGRGLVIGLLAVAVALGGWLTKHALSAR